MTILVSRGGVHFLRLLTTMVLARLLSPEDFGIVAMVMAIAGVANVIRDLGLASATVQQQDISHADVSTLFWINAGLGSLVCVVCIACAPLIAGIYDNATLESVARAVALSFLLNSLGTQHLALLRRQMQYHIIAMTQIVSVLLACVVALLMAYLGAGFWALVGQILAADVILLLLVWWKCNWRPGRFSWNPVTAQMVSYGSYMTGFSLLGYLATNLHLILIGKFLGAAATGLYSRAQFLQTTFVSYITESAGYVAVPAMSRLFPEPDRFRRYYLQALNISLLASAPIGVFLALYASEVVEVLLGDQWQRTGVILGYLALAFPIYPIANSSGWIYQARGDAKGLLRWGIIGWSVGIAAMLIGLQFGLEGVAIGFSTGVYVMTIPCMLMAIHRTTISLPDIFSTMLPSMSSAMLAGLCVWLVARMHGIDNLYLGLFVDGALFSVVYLALLYWVFKMKDEFLDGLNQLGLLKGRR